jgi:protein TonB
MATYNNALYSAYGAYELKAKYQRNFGLSSLGVLALVLFILGVAYVIASLPEEDYSDVPQVVIKTIKDLPPPPVVSKVPPQVQVSAPEIAAPKVGIPKPVADEEVLDEDVTIATRDELAEIVAPDVTQMVEEGGDVVVDIAEEDYLPAPDEFIAVEIYPELIYKHTPAYPKLAKQAGLTGIVQVQLLVDEQGNVLKSQVAKSSGVASLDEAATEAALKCKFKPAIQNGRPIKIWVTFPFIFELDQ